MLSNIIILVKHCIKEELAKVNCILLFDLSISMDF